MKTYRILALVLALLMTLTLAACGGNNDTPSSSTTPAPSTSAGTSDDANVPTDTPQINMGDGTGTYEGETDANGLFSGYGVWTYHNYRYEGYFENGAPNGSGTLSVAMRPQPELGRIVNTLMVVIQGNFINGFADGTISEALHMEDGSVLTWNFDVVMGYAPSDDTVYNSDRDPLDVRADEDNGAVPPWGEVTALWEEYTGDFDNSGTASTPNTPDTSSTPAQSTPDNTIPEPSDWVGTYTNGSATISVADDGNGEYSIILSTNGEEVATVRLNAGVVIDPGEAMMADQHDDPWKSIGEFTLLLSEDYQTVTLTNITPSITAADSWEYNADDFMGEYTRQQ